MPASLPLDPTCPRSEIARMLPGRTENAVKIRYRQLKRSPKDKDSPVKYRGKWTEEEDLALCNAVARHGEKNWRVIARLVPNRDDVQCLQRLPVSGELCLVLRPQRLQLHPVQPLQLAQSPKGVRGDPLWVFNSWWCHVDFLRQRCEQPTPLTKSGSK